MEDVEEVAEALPTIPEDVPTLTTEEATTLPVPVANSDLDEVTDAPESVETEQSPEIVEEDIDTSEPASVTNSTMDDYDSVASEQSNNVSRDEADSHDSHEEVQGLTVASAVGPVSSPSHVSGQFDEIEVDESMLLPTDDEEELIEEETEQVDFREDSSGGFEEVEVPSDNEGDILIADDEPLEDDDTHASIDQVSESDDSAHSGEISPEDEVPNGDTSDESIYSVSDAPREESVPSLDSAVSLSTEDRSSNSVSFMLANNEVFSPSDSAVVNPNLSMEPLTKTASVAHTEPLEFELDEMGPVTGIQIEDSSSRTSVNSSSHSDPFSRQTDDSNEVALIPFVDSNESNASQWTPLSASTPVMTPSGRVFAPAPPTIRNSTMGLYEDEPTDEMGGMDRHNENPTVVPKHEDLNRNSGDTAKIGKVTAAGTVATALAASERSPLDASMPMEDAMSTHPIETSGSYHEAGLEDKSSSHNLGEEFHDESASGDDSVFSGAEEGSDGDMEGVAIEETDDEEPDGVREESLEELDREEFEFDSDDGDDARVKGQSSLVLTAYAGPESDEDSVSLVRTSDDGEDIEIGLEGASEKDSASYRDEYGKSMDEEDSHYRGCCAVFLSNPCTQLLCCVISVLIILGVILVVVLAGGDSPTDGGRPFPTGAPNGGSVTSAPTPDGFTRMPTTLPTNSPTPFNIESVLLAKLSGIAGSSFGFSAAMTRSSRSFMAIGAPEGGAGSVSMYSNSTGQWQSFQVLSSPQQEGRFGAAVSLTDDTSSTGLMVGAPNVLATGTNIPVGAAYYYEYNRADARWAQLGSVIQGGALAENAQEHFGAAVATSDVYRVAIGAPMNNAAAARAGRVYTYEYRQDGAIFDWVPMSDSSVTGTTTDERFGSSLDMSTDGNVMVVGSPFRSLFYIYQWNGSTWSFIFSGSTPGGNLDEEFGSSVAVLSNDFIAAGGPGASNEAGVVRVYELQNNGLFRQFGPDIVGRNGERIGELNSLTGAITERGPAVSVGTVDGLIRRFDYNANLGEWQERFEAVSTGFSGPVSSLSMVTNGLASSIVAGHAAGNEAAVYEAFFGLTANPAGVPDVTLPPVASDSPSPTAVPTPPPGPETMTPSPTAVPIPQPSAESLVPSPGVSSSAPSLLLTLSSAPSPATVNMTVLPTLAPLSGTPSSAPSVALLAISLVRLLPGGSPNTDTGSSVALTDSSLAFGAPLFQNGGGIVQPYRGSGGGYTALDPIFAVNGGRFGEAVDATDGGGRNALLVGAPTAFDEQGLNVRFGAAYYYELVGDVYSMIGSTIEPPLTPQASGGRFGTSVAVARNIRRVAIGAPFTSTSATVQRTGRVYTYDYDGTNWTALETTPVEGFVTDDFLGFDVDLSDDGSRLLVGAPGSTSGVVLYYQLSGLFWQPIFSLPGFESDELFGTTVKILTADGNTIAMGGPGFGASNNGVIRVYRRSSDGTFVQQGQDIVGAANERLGNRNTLTGSNGKLLVGTASGTVKRLDYMVSTDEWTQVSEQENVSRISALDTTGSVDTFLLGDFLIEACPE
ncbi:predicted protein [Phaeodactylum tricornutum CCAP 1055/1]|uniref:Uncharacterized protein n=3 Tax=Phaeodactylum tricornutum TaxID=2850 RepID=B7G848_PHATC|nr:predicted protein [Phaeodactylum tricornutum CCAP 1055/1]EEC45112.1 predicted protein [Phaeodactylum tricornutum CCAP 1055/1]|eukprot:XP_002183412.1 predicted protein [Phaeodactylum tricornutum CCAP 1055/1]